MCLHKTITGISDHIMIEYLINILIILGCIIAVLGGVLFIMFSVVAVYYYLGDIFYTFKLTCIRKKWELNKTEFGISRLEELKKEYPELNIRYDGEEL